MCVFNTMMKIIVLDGWKSLIYYEHKYYQYVHFHPGGSLKASNADIDVTRKICQAMKPISVHVVDHIIVAGDHYVSFAEQGLMETLI